MKKKISNKKHSKKARDFSSPISIITASAFGVGMGLICMSVLLLLCSMICLYAKNPHKLITPLSLFCIYASAFVSGFFCSKRNRSSSLILCGALAGLGFVLLLSLMLFIVELSVFEGSSTAGSILLKALAVPASILGAICTLKRPSPRKHKKR